MIFLKTKLLLPKILCLLIITSCSTLYKGYDSESSYIKFSEVDCINPTDSIDLFFKGEKIDFQYKKAGIIEVYGGDYDSDEAILNKLKEIAKNKCLDAIISIDTGLTEREKGSIFDEEVEKYQSRFFRGIGVKYILN